MTEVKVCSPETDHTAWAGRSVHPSVRPSVRAVIDPQDCFKLCGLSSERQVKVWNEEVNRHSVNKTPGSTRQFKPLTWTGLAERARACVHVVVQRSEDFKQMQVSHRWDYEIKHKDKAPLSVWWSKNRSEISVSLKVDYSTFYVSHYFS